MDGAFAAMAVAASDGDPNKRLLIEFPVTALTTKFEEYEVSVPVATFAASSKWVSDFSFGKYIMYSGQLTGPDPNRSFSKEFL